jgi:hypothetical protein
MCRQLAGITAYVRALGASMGAAQQCSEIFVVQTKIPGIHARKRGNHGN